jgi:hypothetical protein
MIELTCPAEEGIHNAVLRKQARNKDLQTELNNGHWTATLLTVEVGARGFGPLCISMLSKAWFFKSLKKPDLQKTFAYFRQVFVHNLPINELKLAQISHLAHAGCNGSLIFPLLFLLFSSHSSSHETHRAPPRP